MFTTDYETIYWYGVIITWLIGLGIFGVYFGIKNEFYIELCIGVCIIWGLCSLFWPFICIIGIFIGLPYLCVNKTLHKKVTDLFKKK